jgi:hypothetical protein
MADTSSTVQALRREKKRIPYFREVELAINNVHCRSTPATAFAATPKEQPQTFRIRRVLARLGSFMIIFGFRKMWFVGRISVG